MHGEDAQKLVFAFACCGVTRQLLCRAGRARMLMGSVCENYEVFGSRKLVVQVVTLDDVDVFAEVFEKACFVGGGKVQRLCGDTPVELFQ